MDLWRIQVAQLPRDRWQARVWRADVWLYSGYSRKKAEAFMSARRFLESLLRSLAAQLLNSWRRSARTGPAYMNALRFAELPQRLRARVYRRIAPRMYPEEFVRWRSYFDRTHNVYAQWGYFTNDYRESVVIAEPDSVRRAA